MLKLKLLRKVGLGLLLAGMVEQASAFSLLGPYGVDDANAVWQVQLIGYNLPDDIGGPMNLGEEYRWNLPLITYGFDESFFNYFGGKGVEEVEKAIKYLNDMPPFSEMSHELSEYPMDTRRFNYRAGALVIYDLRSFVLSAILEELGLAPAERYVWTLRSRVVIPPPYHTVIKRNFDPVTWQPSSYVNGTLYTYQILQTYASPEVWEAVEFEIDPTLPNVSSVSAIYNVGGGTIGAMGYYLNFTPGLFITGLTRDDMGGLRYLYRPQNFNVENLATNAVPAPLGSRLENVVLGPNTSGSNPWGAPSGYFTNALGTNALGTNVLISAALRPGIDKLRFVRVDFDSMTGSWLPLTNRWVDYYVTNSVLRSQVVERTLPQPDILFVAGDLQVNANGIPYIYRRTIAFSNNDTINGYYIQSGPGVTAPPIVMAVTKVGPFLFHIGAGGEADGIPIWWWGSFDGTTNAPVVYPVHTAIEDVERLVMSGRNDVVSPWRNPLAP